MVQNPLMLPSSLENAPDPINWIGLSDSSLLLVNEDLLIADKTKKKERIRFRRAEAALVVERFLPRLQRELKDNEMRKLVIEVISTKLVLSAHFQEVEWSPLCGKFSINI